MYLFKKLSFILFFCFSLNNEMLRFLFVLVFILYWRVIYEDSDRFANAIATYTPTGTICTSGDGTSNWNSWGQSTIRGATYVNAEPGVCVNGTTLYYPNTIIFPTSFSGACTSFNCLINVFPALTFVPAVSCRLLNLKDRLNSQRIEYGYNPSDSTTLIPDYGHLPGIIPTPEGVGVPISPTGVVSWGIHILQGYMCSFTCTNSNQQLIPSTQNQLYSDGYQSMCHPSNVNQTTLKCINPIVNTTSAPVCVAPLPYCKVTMYPFTYLTFNNASVRSQTYNQTTTIYITPGTSITGFVSSAVGTWNKVYTVTSPPVGAVGPGLSTVGRFTSTCPDHYVTAFFSYSTLSYASIYQYTLIDVPYVTIVSNPPSALTSCPKGYYGSTCLPCQPCSGFYEVCDDGLTGTGSCLLSNVCESRTNNYGVVFTFEPLSSTGLCKSTVLATLFYIIVPNPASPSGRTVIGSGFPTSNTLSWMNQYGVISYNLPITMTIILTPGVVINSTYTFCNQRGSIYGNFTLEHYIRYGLYSPGSMYLFNNSALPNDGTGVQPRCECNPGFYGDQCQFICTVDFITSGGKICHPVTGVPVCPINRFLLPNNTCSTTGCTFNTYGSTCTLKCPRCDLSSITNGFGLYTRCEQDLTSNKLGKCVCPGQDEASPVRIISSTVNSTVATIYPTCTPFHCGYPDPTTGAYCTSVTRGTCITASDNSTSLCICKPGYHGNYCQLTIGCTRSNCGGVTFKDRDCDCGTYWDDTSYTLNKLSKPISVIGLVGDYWYRDNFVAYDPFIVQYQLDTNLWKPLVLYNIPAFSISQAQYACYKYRPCDGLLETPYTDTTSGGSPTSIFYTPFTFDFSSITLQVNTNTSLGGSANISDLIDLSSLWYQSINKSVTLKQQVNVWEIHRTIGYDCANTQLDAKWYFFEHWDEIVNTYGYRYCDLSHRNTVGDCCLKGGGDDALPLSYCSSHFTPSMEVTTGLQSALFRIDLRNNPDPFIIMANRHYDEIGHRKRYSPRQSCDLLPTLYNEQDQCATPKEGCPIGLNSLPCSNQGRCRYNDISVPGAFPHDYQCICAKYSDTSDLDQLNYYSTTTTSSGGGTDTKNIRRYLGYGCELDLDPCVNHNDPGQNQYICNNQPSRCIGINYSVNSTLATPGSISPHCDCDSLDPFTQQISTTRGTYCELSRCGLNGAGCNVNSTTATCVSVGVAPNIVSHCECSNYAEGTSPNLRAWVGSDCNVNADQCISPRLNDHLQPTLCGGPGFGKCLLPGTGDSTHTNYNTIHPWCDCQSFNYTGTTCTTPICTQSVVVPFHGECSGPLSDTANCYRMWRGTSSNAIITGLHTSPCNISSCSATTSKGVPIDSGIVVVGLFGSGTQDSCLCTELWKETRTINKRPGYKNDIVLSPSNNAVGLCYPKCPTKPISDPTAYCGGHGYCIDGTVNTPTTHATCVCDYGYIPKVYTNDLWGGTVEQTCEPYCSINGHIIDDRSSPSHPYANSWNDYISSPLTKPKPICSCDTPGYWNNPFNSSSVTCIDYKCYNGGLWQSIGTGDSGFCVCPTNTLWDPTTFCKTSLCEGTQVSSGIIRGRLNPTNLNICDCADPFTWSNPLTKSDCNSNLCLPNGDLVNITTSSNLPNLSLKGSAICKCKGLYNTLPGNCPNTGDYCHPYCQDSLCSFGGTPFFSTALATTICNCPAPYQPPYCQNHNCGIHGTPNITIGGCTCTFGWTNSASLGLCKQDPCQRPCTSGSKTCGGTFNELTHSCDCFDAWSGTYCTDINVQLATANCSSPHGIAISSTGCLCTALWTGLHCEISRCVAPGSIPVTDPITLVDSCTCPPGYSGLVCDVLAVQSISVTPGDGGGTITNSQSSTTTALTISGITVGSVVVVGLVGYYAVYPLLMTKTTWFPAGLKYLGLVSKS